MSFAIKDHEGVAKLILEFASEVIGFFGIVDEAKFGQFVDDVHVIPIVDVHEPSLSQRRPTQNDPFPGMPHHILEQVILEIAEDMFSHFETLHEVELLF